MEVQIKLNGVYLLVDGIYYRGEPKTYDYPGSASDFEIDAVVVLDSETNIIELLEEFIDEIKEKVIEKIEE
jgi:hypothetical protein